MLCTVAEIKDRAGERSTDYDAQLALIAAAVTSQFEDFTGRKLIVTDADETEYYTGCSDYLQLKRYPIVSITSIKESFTYDFDNATAMTANTDYRLLSDGEKGLLLRLYTDWCPQPDSIQIVYRGGFTAAGDTPGEGETAVPADLKEAAIQQAMYLWQRKGRDIGLSGQTFEGGGFNKIETGDIIDSARKVLLRYKRITLL